MWLTTAGAYHPLMLPTTLHGLTLPPFPATSTITCYIEATIGNGNLNQTQFEPFITSTLVLTLATNLITTGMSLPYGLLHTSHSISPE